MTKTIQTVQALMAVSCATMLIATTALATPVTVLSKTDVRHDFIINSGALPDGLTMGFLPGASLDITAGVSAAINDDATVETVESQSIVGNQFLDPPRPAQFMRSVTSAIPLTGEEAVAGYDVDITMFDDYNPDESVSGIVERRIDNQGFAQILLDETGTDAAATSFYNNYRRYLFENTTNSAISFSIAGTLRLLLSASVLEGNGLARAAGGVSMLFDTSAGTDLNFTPLSPYAPDSFETGAGAFVSDTLLTTFSGLEGFWLTAGVTAQSTGALTEAFYTVSMDYQLDILMGAGESLMFETSFQQANSAEAILPIAPVPLPAGLPLILAALGSLAMLRRKP